MTQLPNDFDVMIAGAGPAGVAAAITLSSSGLRCVVFEKADGKRTKHCGGAVSPKAVKLYAELGLNEDYFQSAGFAANEGLISGFGSTVHGHTPDRSYGYFVDRSELDWSFQQLAIAKHGIALHYGCEIVSVSCEGGRVQVEVNEGATTNSYGCRFLIGADGVASRARTQLLQEKISDLNKILTCSAILECGSAERPAVRFHEDFMPTYSWVFPYTHNRVNVGIGMYANVYSRLNDRSLLQDLIGRMAEATGLTVKPHLSNWIINTNPFQKRVVNGRTFLVGDAGGFVDAVTGEGISFALGSGIAAAKTILLAQKIGRLANWSFRVRILPTQTRLVFSKVLQLLLTRFPRLAGFVLSRCTTNRVVERAVFKYFSHS